MKNNDKQNNTIVRQPERRTPSCWPPMITNSVMTLPVKSNVIQNTKHKARNYSNTKLRKCNTKKKRNDQLCSRVETPSVAFV